MTDRTTEQLLRSMHRSLAVRWGTTAPFTIGRVRCEQVGFARIACDETGHSRARSMRINIHYQWLDASGFGQRQPFIDFVFACCDQ